MSSSKSLIETIRSKFTDFPGLTRRNGNHIISDYERSACVIRCRHGWSNCECENSVNSYSVWCSISVLEFFTIIQLITYPLTSPILRYALVTH